MDLSYGNTGKIKNKCINKKSLHKYNEGIFLLEKFSIIFTLIGTYIGAGFISGKEIYIYFYQHGACGLIEIILSNIFAGHILYNTINISKKLNTNNYDEFFNKIIKNKIIKKIFGIYFQVSFGVMISGFCGFINQELKINKYIIFLIFLLIIFYTLKNNINCILKINSYLIPIIILFIIYIFFMTKNNNIIVEFKYDKKINYFFSWFIYANYNLISLIPITIINSSQMKNKFFICFIFSSIIIILSMLLFNVLSIIDNDKISLSFPLVSILEQHGKIYKYIYYIVLGISIYSTAVSLGYNFYKNIKRMLSTLILSFILIHVSFSKLIEIIYPIFGICGIYQCYCISASSLKKNKGIA